MLNRFFSKKSILKLIISVVIEKDQGGFHAFAPGLKGLHVDGMTEDEVLQNARDAIRVYLVSLARHNDALPIGPHLTLEREIIPEIPPGALLRNVTVQWPSLQMSGTS